MEKYKILIENINDAIRLFNEYLKADYSIPLLKFDFEDADYYNLIKTKWGEGRYPNGPSKGVYIIFACNQENPYETAVYIGKASLSSTIGIRLDDHKRRFIKDGKYVINWHDEIKFDIELITSIPLENKIAFLAPSLEELLISQLGNKKIDLLNTKGV